MQYSRGLVAVLLSALCVCGCDEEEQPDPRGNVTGTYPVTGTRRTVRGDGQTQEAPIQETLVIEPEKDGAEGLLRVTLKEMGREGCTFQARMEGERTFIAEASECFLDYVTHCYQYNHFEEGRGEKLPSGVVQLSLQGTYEETCAPGGTFTWDLSLELASQ